VLSSRTRILVVLLTFGASWGCGKEEPAKPDASPSPDAKDAPSMPPDAAKDTPTTTPDGPTPDGMPDTAPAAFGSIEGRLTIAGKADPVAGAEVSAGGIKTTTDDGGRFLLDQVPVGDRVVVRANKVGFAEALEPVTVTRDMRSFVTAGLLPASGILQMDVTTGGQVNDHLGSTAKFVAGSLVKANGEAASGPATVTVAALDATDPISMQAFPGDFTARRMDGSDVMIETVVPMSVSVRQGGEELNIKPGMNADLTLPIPPELAAGAPETIPLWSLDPKTGGWKEEGTATRQADPEAPSGFVYKATVSHLSWWNADKPITVTCIRGCVKMNDAPAGRVAVHAVGQDYSGETTAATGADGCFALDLKRSSHVLVWAENKDALSDGITVPTPETLMRAATGAAQCKDVGTIALKPRAMANDGCPMGLLRCGESCVNPQSDKAHCGGCNQDCDLACTDGKCACPPSQTQCGHSCANTSTDRDNCGGCGHICPQGQMCTNGTCVAIVCPQGKTVCNNECVDTQTDGYNCGACNASCNVQGRQVCSGGACACPAGLTTCPGGPVDAPRSRVRASTDFCADVKTDRYNCGGCGTICAVGKTCTNGSCADIVCPQGRTLCGNDCVDLTSDSEHCGGCDTSCHGSDGEGGAMVCKDSVCACPQGQTKCTAQGGEGGSYSFCADTSNNRYNCGGCGTTCEVGKTCTGGTCVAITCPQGQTLCGNDCVDAQTDAQHCGGCDTHCNGESREICQAGACVCPSGYMKCSIGENFSICFDTQNDRYHCGGCNTTCPNGQTCTGGACVAITCAQGQTLCGNDCTNLQTDPYHCGTCETHCGGESGESCQQGTCVCPGGQTRCMVGEGFYQCRDTQTDRYNCGSCGTTCPAGQTCSGGTCAAITCQQGTTLCQDSCVNLTTDRNNCGTCGSYCFERQSCVEGKCTCSQGLTFCSDQELGSGCADLQNDAFNCGTCFKLCPSGPCVAGQCQVAPQIRR
jgi:hypothetical protein